MKAFPTSRRSVRTVGIAATIGFVGFAAFQAALVVGAPLGKAAWGGGSARLAVGLRVASGFAILVHLFAAAVMYQRSGLGEARLRRTLVRKAAWVLTGLMFLGTLTNWASRSPVERYTWGPLTLVMAVLCLIIARSE